MSYSLSQNAHPVVLIEVDGLNFLLPECQNNSGSKLFTFHCSLLPQTLASCTTFLLCLCKSFKELFLYAHAQDSDFSSRKPAVLGIAQVNLALLSLARFLSESGCKGTTFFRTAKLFPNFFALKRENFLDS